MYNCVCGVIRTFLEPSMSVPNLMFTKYDSKPYSLVINVLKKHNYGHNMAYTVLDSEGHNMAYAILGTEGHNMAYTMLDTEGHNMVYTMLVIEGQGGAMQLMFAVYKLVYQLIAAKVYIEAISRRFPAHHQSADLFTCS